MTTTQTAPTLHLPAEGAALDASAADFSWDAVPGATYRLQISESPSFADPILDLHVGAVPEVTLTDTLLPTDEPRFWRVGAAEASGEVAWSGSRPFTLPAPAALAKIRGAAEKARQAEEAATAASEREAARAARGLTVVPDLPPPPALPALPTGATISGDVSTTDWRRVPGVATHEADAPASGEAPTVLGPLGGAIADGASTVFRWTEVPGATGYEIEIGPDLSGPTLRLDAGTTTELALGGLLPSVGDRLFWRVRARTEAGMSAWSKYGRFYAGTDLQAAAYHDRQEAERAYARRVQDHERLQQQADLDLIAPCQQPIDPNDTMGYALIMAMLAIGIVMILAAAIGGLVVV
ncbi:MAG: fibronectin type III domain-containing protein [Bacteroidota bacterium]